MSREFHKSTYGDEEVWNSLLVLCPCLTILGSAALNVTHGTVGNHTGEEDRIEPGERTLEAGDKTPHECEVEIAGVVDLAGVAI